MHEVIHVDDQVFDDWKVGERFHLDRPTLELMEKASTGELRDAINVCTTAAADPHSARPTIGQRPIQIRLDVVESVKNNHILPIGHFVILKVGLPIFLGSVSCYSNRCGIL